MRRRAILSVYDKRGVVDFARGLSELGFEIVSTGGTARVLRDASIEVLDVSAVTGFPECLDGRVKTLHPGVLAGVLAADKHVAELRELGIEQIELVAVNLYPFEETVARPMVTEEEAIENIDIGGPTMIRAAAKNADRVTVIVDPEDYTPVLEELREHGSTSLATRKRLRAKVFSLTAAYDAAIARWLTREESFPEFYVMSGVKVYDLRYGENPHQRAAVYQVQGLGNGIFGAVKHQGKPLSYNNLVDMDAAWVLVREFEQPAVAIIKHANPCGVGRDASDIVAAYEKALATDPVSAFGGIVAANREIDEALARRMCEHFYEVVVAPSITPNALETFASKKNLRVMEMGDEFFRPLPNILFRSVSGGFLLQDADPIADEARSARVVTARAPTQAEWEAMDFAWRVAKHVKSNAIVFVRADATAAIGAGQMSRVDSVKLAVAKARCDLTGTVVGSDAFFPFPDGVEEIAKAGATAIVQPGGSIRDSEVIAMADKHGLAMVFTDRRHFKH